MLNWLSSQNLSPILNNLMVFTKSITEEDTILRCYITNTLNFEKNTF